MVGFEIAALLVLFITGMLSLGRGALEFRKTAHVLLGNPMQVADLAGHTGPVVIEGTASEADGTVYAPFSGRECLAYVYTVEELYRVGPKRRLREIDSGNDSVPFDLNDGTGTVRIEPDGADLRFESHETTVAADEVYSDRIKEFVDSSNAVNSSGSIDAPLTDLVHQRFIERRLDPGEEAYVYGEVFSEPVGTWGSDSVDAVVRSGDSTPVFIVADEPKRRAAWLVARRGIFFVAIGLLVLGPVTVWFLLAT